MNLWIDFAYLIAAVLFILGIKKMGMVKTARQGNGFAMLAMLLAVTVTLLDRGVINYQMIACGVALGTLIGVVR